MKHQYTPPMTTRVAYCLSPMLAASPQYDHVLNMEDDDENTTYIFDRGNKGNIEDARAKENKDWWD